jgi:CrcB protein
MGAALQTVLWISIGAIFGTNLRYFLGQFITKLSPPNFPYATLFINFTGSFVLGFFLVLTGERILADPRWRLLIAVGFLGGYTALGNFAYETFALLEQGH